MDRPEQLKLAYTEALAQLRQHPTLIWTRNNFFLLIDSGLLAFAVSKDFGDWSNSRLLVPVSGVFISFIWLWVNIAGQRLQRHWRKLVLELEQELFKPDEGRPPVYGPFTLASLTAKEGTSAVVSITTALILLSAGFLACWLYLLVKIALTR